MYSHGSTATQEQSKAKIYKHHSGEVLDIENFSTQNHLQNRIAHQSLLLTLQQVESGQHISPFYLCFLSLYRIKFSFILLKLIDFK